MIKAINAFELGKDRKKDFRLFLLAFALFWAFGLAFQFHYGWYSASSYVTTLLAFSYLKTGFFRRGLVGTLYDVFCRIFPAALSYKGAVWFMWVMNLIYFAALLLFVRWIFGKIRDEKAYRGAYFFSLICFAFMIPSVCCSIGALGRADLIQIVICIWQIYLLMEGKHEWLTLPLSAVNVLFHEGYVLMTFCTVLIVIVYRALYAEGKKLKYWLLFFLNIAVVGIVSVLSLKGGSYVGSPEGYEDALAFAASLNRDGYVHYNLLSMMAGYRPEGAQTINDAAIVAENMQELPVFLACFVPAFIVFGKGLVNLFWEAGKNRVGLHITALLLGPALIGVEYIKYCDYGRYILWLVFYFFIVFLTFAAMEDKGAEGSLSVSYGSWSNLKAVLITALMMIYQPLPTCSFTFISQFIRLHIM